jgi:hypothetical protein
MRYGCELGFLQQPRGEFGDCRNGRRNIPECSSFCNTISDWLQYIITIFHTGTGILIFGAACSLRLRSCWFRSIGIA